MEEDIKILEEFINYYAINRLISPLEIQAIENLIKRNKELERYERYYKNERVELIPKSKLRELINKRGNNGYTSLDCVDDIENLLQEGDK